MKRAIGLGAASAVIAIVLAWLVMGVTFAILSNSALTLARVHRA